MKTLRSLVLIVAALSCACASLKTADGKLNVPVLLQDAGYGIELDCAIGTDALAQNVCTFGRDGLAAAQAAYAKDPASGQAAVKQVLIDLVGAEPQLGAYLTYVINRL